MLTINGHVTSNQLETINFISNIMTVNYSGRKKAWSYDVYNRTTRSSNRGLLMDHGRFVIDYSPTVFNMRVYEGQNDVEYVFKKCPNIVTDANGNKECQADLVVEKEGILRIYAVETVPGVREIRPSESQCKPNP